MNKKIYLITFHRAQSYGAFLQAFALQKCKALVKYNPIYIDYYPNRFTYKGFAFSVGGKSFLIKILKFIPSVIAKTRFHMCINRFVNKYLNRTKKIYRHPDELNDFGENGSIFISGGDQIWDTRYDELRNVLPYYLTFAHGYKYSYSTSCGELKYCTGLNIENAKNIRIALMDYEKISVRELASVNDLNKFLNISDVQMMLDPTFLLNEYEWNQVIKEEKCNAVDYVLVYDLHKDKQLRAYARKLAVANNLRIVNICDIFDFMRGARNFLNTNPFRLLKLISNATHVVTNSFHGCALSINFHRQLHVFMPPRSIERLNNLLNLFEIECRIPCGDELIMKKMDYDRIDNILKEKRNLAETYLKSITES